MKKISLIISALVFGIVLVNGLDDRVQAQTTPSMRLVPASGNVDPSTATSFDLQLSTGTSEATSYVAAIDVSGTTLSDLAINSTPPPGMTTQGAGVSGNQIQLEVTGGAGSGTVNTNNTYLTIATITFTSPASGATTFDLNSSFSAIYAGVSGNILATFFSETYTFQSAAPTSTPTNTPIPPTNTPAANTLTANVSVRLQSIDYVSPAMNLTASLKTAGSTGSALATSTVSAASGSDGVFAANFTFNGVANGTYKLCVKGPSHLQSCFDNIDFSSGSASVVRTTSSNDLLLVGDVTDDNIISAEDVGAVNAVYGLGGQFSVPAGTNGTDPDVDLNRDGYVTVQDLALAILNFTSFSILGDE